MALRLLRIFPSISNQIIPQSLFLLEPVTGGSICPRSGGTEKEDSKKLNEARASYARKEKYWITVIVYDIRYGKTRRPPTELSVDIFLSFDVKEAEKW